MCEAWDAVGLAVFGENKLIGKTKQGMLWLQKSLKSTSLMSIWMNGEGEVLLLFWWIHIGC